MAQYEVIQGIGSFDATYSYIEVRPPLSPELKRAFDWALDYFIVIDEVQAPEGSTLYEVHHEEPRHWPSEGALVMDAMLNTLTEAGAKVDAYPTIAVDGDESLFLQRARERGCSVS